VRSAKEDGKRFPSPAAGLCLVSQNFLSFTSILQSNMTSEPGATSDPQKKSEKKSKNDDAPPSSATQAVLVASAPMPEHVRQVRGVDFNQFRDRDITVPELIANMSGMGFQASAVAEAVRIINDMVCPYLRGV
jgi:hypothetical protein